MSGKSTGTASSRPEYTTFSFADDGRFPNNGWYPLLLYPRVFGTGAGVDPRDIERRFADNGWRGSWRNGLFTCHHYHSTAHEVLGVYAGWVEALLGGPKGVKVTARAGDVIVVPAGVAHKNLDQSSDFRVVGAYPLGQTPDMCYGEDSERPAADERIAAVAPPEGDPVYGRMGPLTDTWR